MKAPTSPLNQDRSLVPYRAPTTPLPARTAPTESTSRALVPYTPPSQALVPLQREEIAHLSRSAPRDVASPSSAFNTLVRARSQRDDVEPYDPRGAPSTSRAVVPFDPAVARDAERRLPRPEARPALTGPEARLALTGPAPRLALTGPDPVGDAVLRSHAAFDRDLSSHLHLLQAVSADPSMTGWHIEEAMHHLTRHFPSSPRVAERLAQLEAAGERATRWKTLGLQATPDTIDTVVRGEAAAIQRELDGLREGQSLVLPGGWHGSKGGHAMLYEIQKGKDGAATFRVYNTGVGILEHTPNKGINKAKIVRLLQARASNEELAKLGVQRKDLGQADPAILRQLGRKHLSEKDLKGCFQVQTMVQARYLPDGQLDHHALESLIRMRMEQQPGTPEACVKRVLGAVESMGGMEVRDDSRRLQSPQSTENCTWKVGMAYLRNNMHVEGDYEHAKTAMYRSVLDRSAQLYDGLRRDIDRMKREAAGNGDEIAALGRREQEVVRHIQQSLPQLRLPSDPLDLDTDVVAHFKGKTMPTGIKAALAELDDLRDRKETLSHELDLLTASSKLRELESLTRQVAHKAQRHLEKHG